MECPSCGKPMDYKGLNRYECTNPECPVIEVKANEFGILRVKQDSRGRIIKEGVTN